MEKIVPRTLPGFIELYPHEQVEFERMKNIIIDTYNAYGFFPLDTPTLEFSDVILAKSGGDTDKQVYRFMKGATDLSMRFDLTVPLAKYVASRYNELAFPFKRYQIGKVFRGERPQKGRYREFYQCDIDIIGDEVLSIKYDSEVISMIYDIFNKFNIGNFFIKINNRKILTGFFENLNLKEKSSSIIRLIDKLDKIGEETLIGSLKDLELSENEINEIMNFIKIKGSNQEKIEKLRNLNIKNETFNEGVNELEAIINDLRARRMTSDKYRIDLTVARGHDYYTGCVYETFLTDHTDFGCVCGGGRYDNLAEYYTDKKLPGVGMSIGLSRLFNQLLDEGIIDAKMTSPSDVMIIPFCDNYEYIYEVKDELVNMGISVNICYIEKGIKQKIRYADKLKTKYAILIGEDEINKNSIVLKNMYEGTQVEISRENLNTIKETYL